MNTSDIGQCLMEKNQQFLAYISADEASITARTGMSKSHDQHVSCLCTRPHSEICYTGVGSDLRTLNTLTVFRLAGGYIRIARSYAVWFKHLCVEISMGIT